jgi:hypothetical protein
VAVAVFVVSFDLQLQRCLNFADGRAILQLHLPVCSHTGCCRHLFDRLLVPVLFLLVLEQGNPSWNVGYEVPG